MDSKELKESYFSTHATSHTHSHACVCACTGVHTDLLPSPNSVIKILFWLVVPGPGRHDSRSRKLDGQIAPAFRKQGDRELTGSGAITHMYLLH